MLPKLDDDYHVTFFPEGGHILIGTKQKVAFKAIDPNGYSLPLKGKVLTHDNQVVSTFQTEQRGMGIFEITTQSEKEMNVEFISEKGIRKTFTLPKPLANGFALTLDTVGDTYIMSIRKAEHTASIDSLRLLLHTRGNLLGVLDMSVTDRIELHESDFPAGILHAVLLTQDNAPLSERLVFIRPQQSISTIFSTDQPLYGKWEDAKLRMGMENLCKAISLFPLRTTATFV